MHLYEAIFVRKSTRQYVFDPLPEETLESLREHYRELPGLFGNIRTDIAIIDNLKGKRRNAGLFSVRAPYYLAFYSEEASRYQMNIGFLMEQMALYLCTQEIGTCHLGLARLPKDMRTTPEGLTLVGIMAFGKARGSHVRKRNDAKRLTVEELSVFKEVPRQWMKNLLEAARMAPSAFNAQPWRFVVYDNRIHIFTKKPRNSVFQRERLIELDIGVMLAHVMIAAEEMWLDMDLIRLDNLSQKNFPNNQYVLSAIMKS